MAKTESQQLRWRRWARNSRQLDVNATYLPCLEHRALSDVVEFLYQTLTLKTDGVCDAQK